jgi:hypothetical protein
VTIIPWPSIVFNWLGSYLDINGASPKITNEDEVLVEKSGLQTETLKKSDAGALAFTARRIRASSRDVDFYARRLLGYDGINIAFANLIRIYIYQQDFFS